MLDPFDLTECQPSNHDRPPRLVFGTRPLYPAHERLKGKMGDAVIQFRVRVDGSVEPISRTEKNVWFANHAVVAMRDWKIEPAMKGGVPMETICEVSFSYVLR